MGTGPSGPAWKIATEAETRARAGRIGVVTPGLRAAYPSDTVCPSDTARGDAGIGERRQSSSIIPSSMR